MPVAVDKPPEPNAQRRAAAELRRRFAASLTRPALGSLVGRVEILRNLDSLLAEFEPRLADALSVSIASGFLSGAEASLSRLPGTAPVFAPPLVSSPPQKPPDLPSLLMDSPEDGPRVELTSIKVAAEKLAKRRVMAPEDYYRLADAAKQQAFTVSGGLTDDARQKLHGLLTADLSEGTSFTGFRDAVLDKFDRLPISESHLEQVYRNNVQESFSQGMDHVLSNPFVADEFPYRLYVPIHDARARPEHRALEHLGINGTAVYYKDDPTWLKFRPPWSFSCRCGWVPLSISDAARRGVQEAIEWRETGVEPPHHWVNPPPFNPPPGWNRTALGAAV